MIFFYIFFTLEQQESLSDHQMSKLIILKFLEISCYLEYFYIWCFIYRLWFRPYDVL